jgi:cation diffusion facilitator family transporter
VLLVSVLLNGFLSVATTVTGVVSRSPALLSDAIHTASDVLTTIIVVIGMRFSSKEADENHPYGHEKIESVLSMMMSLFLIVVSAGIGYTGFVGLFNPNFHRPIGAALFASFLSMSLKEIMYRYMHYGAKKLGSDAIMADAWHQRVDALSSAGVFVGVLGTHFGFYALDSAAAIVISLMTLRAAVGIYLDSLKQLTDTSADKKTIKELEKLAKGVDGVRDVKKIKTRMLSRQLYVEMEVSMDGGVSLDSARKTANCVENDVRNKFDFVKSCMVYLTPYKATDGEIS